MFTDMTGYTALTQRDESLALSLLDKQNGILLPLIRAFGGTPVKTIGDAHLAEFDNTLAAIRCAVEIQRKVEMYDKSASPEEGFKLRIGIHLGDVIHKDNDVYGDAVNIAARLQPIAEPGGVCVSQQVYDQVQNKVEFKLERLPARQLRNVNSRINVYRVIDSKAAPASIVEEEDQPKERVAVLPLSNFSPSQQDEYLADGMTEELITAISGVQGLRVIARTSVMRFKNAGVDIAEIGRTLGVGTVLQGSFRKAGDRIRVTVQLIDAKSEEHVWASNYDGDLKDIFSIQTDIANKVA
jgi:adenylate cyclase